MPAATHPPVRTLGAVLAGGASRRFGSPKALAEVGGRTVIERVTSAVARAADETVLIANDAALFAHLALPVRADEVAGAGPLAGIATALGWAAERGGAGALCIACDLPFISPALLRLLVRTAAEGGWDAVLPESGGRRGVEPLCAWYSADCVDAARDALRRGERAVVAFVDGLRTLRIPLDEVRRCGDPEVIFLNLNTPADLARARELADAGE